MGLFDFLVTIAVGAVLGAVAGGVTAYVVDYFISKQTLKADLSKKCPDAIYAKIQDIKKNKGTVDIGLYDESNSKISSMTYQSDKGISSDIQVGEYIML